MKETIVVTTYFITNFSNLMKHLPMKPEHKASSAKDRKETARLAGWNELAGFRCQHKPRDKAHPISYRQQHCYGTKKMMIANGNRGVSSCDQSMTGAGWAHLKEIQDGLLLISVQLQDSCYNFHQTWPVHGALRWKQVDGVKMSLGWHIVAWGI